MLKCLIAFILGWLASRMMGNGFSVGGTEDECIDTSTAYFTDYKCDHLANHGFCSTTEEELERKKNNIDIDDQLKDLKEAQFQAAFDTCRRTCGVCTGEKFTECKDDSTYQYPSEYSCKKLKEDDYCSTSWDEVHEKREQNPTKSVSKYNVAMNTCKRTCKVADVCS